MPKGIQSIFRKNIRGKTEETIYDVIAEYYNTLLANQLLKVAENAVSSAAAYLENVMQKQTGGAATGVCGFTC